MCSTTHSTTAAPSPSYSSVLVKAASACVLGFVGYDQWRRRSPASGCRTIIPLKKAHSGGVLMSAMDFEVKRDTQWEERMKNDSELLAFTVDFYNGARIHGSDVPTEVWEFKRRLSHTLAIWRSHKLRGVWVQLKTEVVDTHSATVLQHGFQMHHCRPQYLMFQQWLPTDEPSMIPEYCHCYMSGAALIVNSKRQVVVIEDKWNFGSAKWKLPCGGVDLGESPQNAALREAKEETGIDAHFVALLGFRHKAVFRFGNTSDILFVALLKPKDERQQFVADPNEIAKVQWMDLDLFLSTELGGKLLSDSRWREAVNAEVNWLIQHWDDAELLKSNAKGPAGLRCAKDESDHYKKRNNTVHTFF